MTTRSHPPRSAPSRSNRKPAYGRSLDWLPPTIFDGDRSKTSCNYIRGPKVDDWVADQVDALQVKVFGDANNVPTHADTDEALWQNFMAEFRRVFTDPGAKEKAIAELRTPEMTGEDIQDYILTFEDLLMEAGWRRDTVETVDYFRDGLPTNLHRHVLNWDHTPVTRIRALPQTRRRRPARKAQV